MFFEKYRDGSYQWRWRLKAASGEIIASGEAYTTEANRDNAIRLVKSAGNADVRKK